jgi:hypothetical protein
MVFVLCSIEHMNRKSSYEGKHVSPSTSCLSMMCPTGDEPFEECSLFVPTMHPDELVTRIDAQCLPTLTNIDKHSS